MAYHKHPERTFYIQTMIPPRSIRVDRREDAIFLNDAPLLSVRVHKDSTIEIYTASMLGTEEGYIFSGFEIWRMLHDDEESDPNYAGCLEAQLLGIKLLANFNNKEWIQQQTPGKDADEEEEESFD